MTEPIPFSTTSSQRYLFQKRLGEGGSSVLEKCLDTRIGRPVVLKRFFSYENEKVDPVTSPDWLAELTALTTIIHPNVICCYDAGHDEKGPYLVLEHIDGADLQTLVSEHPMDLKTFNQFATECLQALDAVHASGILHLDLKPGNIMMAWDGAGQVSARVIDFGRAEPFQNERGEPPRGRGVNGSIHFCAPEIFLATELDSRTDLYALGCTFYFCLTGEYPFQGENPMLVMAAHMHHLVTPLQELRPDLPEDLSDWIMSLISIEADDRPTSASAALAARQHHSSRAPRRKTA